MLVPDIQQAMGQTPAAIETIGIPHHVLANYGTPQEHDVSLGFTPERIRERIEQFIH